MSLTDHLDDRSLDLYVIGDGDEPLRVLVEAHVALCEACHHRQRSLQSLVAAARSVASVAPQQRLLDRIHQSGAIREGGVQPADRVLSIPRATMRDGDTAPADGQPAPRSRWSSTARIAAMILVVLGSVVGLAQAIVYVARRKAARRTGAVPIVAHVDRPGILGSGDTIRREISDGPGRIRPSRLALQSVPVRDLPQATATGSVFATGRGGTGPSIPASIRVEPVHPLIELRGGAILTADRQGRVVLIDSTLSQVLDYLATESTINGAALLHAHGDSVLVGNPRDRVFLVLDPRGVRAGTLPMAAPGDATWQGGVHSALDPTGRLVYKGADRSAFAVSVNDGGPTPAANTAPLLRLDPSTARVDTIGDLRRIGPVRFSIRFPDRRTVNRDSIAVMPVHDAWAMLTDGSVAVVRAADYHIDWIRPDGTRERTGPLAADRAPMTRADKIALIEEIRLGRHRDDSVRTTVRTGLGEFRPGTAPGEVVYPSPGVLPEVDTAFDPDQVIADLDGRLWVLRRTIPRDADRRPTYDVIDRRGTIVDRVRVPAGTMILGFGRGVVYTTQPAAGGITISRVPLR